MAAIGSTTWQFQKHINTDAPITTSVAWEGKLVTADLNGVVRIWDVETSKPIKSVQFGGGNAMFNCGAVVKGNLYFQAQMPSTGHASWPIVKMDPNTLKITAQYPDPAASEPLFDSMVADVSHIWGLTMKGRVMKLNADDLSPVGNFDPGMAGGSANVLLNVEDVMAIGGSEGAVNLFLKEGWTSLGSIGTQYGDLSLNQLPGRGLSVSNLSGQEAWFYSFGVPPTTPLGAAQLPDIGYASVALQTGSSLFLGTEEGVALYAANPLVFQEMLTQKQSNNWINLVKVDDHTVIATGESGWDLLSDQSLPQ
jgi:hypothetical protein